MLFLEPASCKVPKLPGLLEDYYTCTQPSTWGYTFDDGPTCEHNALYDFMERQNQTSTLYYVRVLRLVSRPDLSEQQIGQNVLQWPLEAQKGYLGGRALLSRPPVRMLTSRPQTRSARTPGATTTRPA
jgi:hypothetical protein